MLFHSVLSTFASSWLALSCLHHFPLIGFIFAFIIINNQKIQNMAYQFHILRQKFMFNILHSLQLYEQNGQTLCSDFAPKKMLQKEILEHLDNMEIWILII